MAAALTGEANATDISSNSAYTVKVERTNGSMVVTGTGSLKQQQEGWQGNTEDVGGVDVSSQTPTAGGSFTITFTEADNETTVEFE